MTTETAQFIKAGANGTSGTITTSTVTDGLLNPEQSKTYWRNVMDKIALVQMVRHEMRRAPSGKIDKIGISEGIIRPYVENEPDDYNARPNYGHIAYSVNEWWLPWSISNQTLRENIEGDNYANTVESLMTAAMARDIERCAVNGDKDIKADAEFAKMLSLDDGWIKQIKSDGGHVLDGAAHDYLNLDVWGEMLQEMPSKYIDSGDLAWLVNPHVATQWAINMAKYAAEGGGIVGDAFVKNPCGFKMIPVPSMPKGSVILTRPQNLIIVHTFNVQIRKTTEGVTALRHDSIYFTIRFDMDYVIENTDATVLIENLPTNIFSKGHAVSAAMKAAASAKKPA